MRFFALLIFDGVIMNGHTQASTTQNIGCLSIMTPSKMGKTKDLIFYSLNPINLFNIPSNDLLRNLYCLLPTTVCPRKNGNGGINDHI